MKVYLLVDNYANTIRGHFPTKKKADAANTALRGTFASVKEVSFVSPMEQKKLDALPAPTARR